MLATTTCDSVEIDAPDGADALDLEHRLRYVARAEAVRGPGWFVDISGPVDVQVVEVVVRAWLRDIGESSTIVRIDGSEHELTSHRATHNDFEGLNSARATDRPWANKSQPLIASPWSAQGAARGTAVQGTRIAAVPPFRQW